MIINACAKLNLALDIPAVRSDGYHEMKMVMQSVDLCDTLTAEFERSGDLTVESSEEIAGENIAEKAVRLYSEAAGFPIGGRIYIEKRIPVCGGLGGGSADAAAVLTALQRQFGAVSQNVIDTLAVSLGADVPFALTGGTKYAGGVGEILQNVRPMPNYTIVLCACGKKASTGSMFARFDESRSKSHPDIDGIVGLLNGGNFDAAARLFGNSFTPLWSGDRLNEIFRIFDNHGAVGSSLSGAGPTVFGIFGDEAEAKKCREESAALTGWAYICHPTERSIEIIE